MKVEDKKKLRREPGRGRKRESIHGQGTSKQGAHTSQPCDAVVIKMVTSWW
jgi:hypothetical protein